MTNCLFLFLFLANFAKAPPLAKTLQEQPHAVLYKVVSYSARNLEDLITLSKVNLGYDDAVYKSNIGLLKRKVGDLLHGQNKYALFQTKPGMFFLGEYNLLELMNFDDFSSIRNINKISEENLFRFLGFYKSMKINKSQYCSSGIANNDIANFSDVASANADADVAHDAMTIAEYASTVADDDVDNSPENLIITKFVTSNDIITSFCPFKTLFFICLDHFEELFKYPLLESELKHILILRKLQNDFNRFLNANFNQDISEIFEARKKVIHSKVAKIFWLFISNVQNIDNMLAKLKALSHAEVKEIFDNMKYFSRLSNNKEQWRNIYAKFLPIFLESLKLKDYHFLRSIQVRLLNFFGDHVNLEDIELIRIKLNQKNSNNIDNVNIIFDFFDNMSLSCNDNALTEIANDKILTVFANNRAAGKEPRSNFIKNIEQMLGANHLLIKNSKAIFMRIVQLIITKEEYHNNNLEFLIGLKEHASDLIQYPSESKWDLIIEDIDCKISAIREMLSYKFM